MADLSDGESVEMQGSGAKPYVLKNVGGVYSCTCPAWRNQSIAIEKRTCKHLRKLRGDAAEATRVGAAAATPGATKKDAGDEKEDAGEAAPPLLLAESWDNSLDLSGWWMSEKLDGVRAWWDGTQFLSRLGNRYHAPDWFVEGLPKTVLDGELWIDRKAFQKTVSIVRRQDKSDHWKGVRFLIFDAPQAGGPFEERVEYLRDGFGTWRNQYAALHEHMLCTDLSHLRQELARVESLGGEGLMLREPGSVYRAGRSATLLKVKTFRDAEAEVLGHEPGKGRHKGRLGALLVRLPSGKEFSVGTGFSDKQRENPPPVGSQITFRYQELSDGGIPRFPSFVGVRVEAPTGGETAVTQGVAPRKAPGKQSAKPTSKSASEPATKPAGRYFEFVEGSSRKFWEVRLDGSDLTTRWGRIGADGQSKTKSFATEEKARAEYEKLVEEKTGKGYLEK
jgi:DNA ligase-1